MNIQHIEALYALTPHHLPTYRRIQMLITTEISDGNLRPGDPVPSENDFVMALNISRMTANRALRELSTDGILTRTRGLGTFVAKTAITVIPLKVRNTADEIKIYAKPIPSTSSR